MHGLLRCEVCSVCMLTVLDHIFGLLNNQEESYEWLSYINRLLLQVLKVFISFSQAFL